jgi:hypothetical protein
MEKVIVFFLVVLIFSPSYSQPLKPNNEEGKTFLGEAGRIVAGAIVGEIIHRGVERVINRPTPTPSPTPSRPNPTHSYTPDRGGEMCPPTAHPGPGDR